MKRRLLLLTATAALAVSASGLFAQGIPYYIDPSRPFGPMAMPPPSPPFNRYDPIQLQTFVETLNRSDRQEIDGRCGIILAYPGAFPPDAAMFCNSFRLAATISPKNNTDQDENNQNS